MIRNEPEFEIAQQSVANLERILLDAHRTHTPAQYALMSKTFLLELQGRYYEILRYLMFGEEPEGPAG